MLAEAVVRRILAEQIAQRGAPSLEAVCGAWRQVVGEIFKEFSGEADWQPRQPIAESAVLVCIKVLPYTLQEDVTAWSFPGQALDGLRQYYRITLALAALVHLSVLMNAQSQLADASQAVREVQEFCLQSLHEIDATAKTGTVICRRVGFQTLFYYQKVLLRISLGPMFVSRFIASFDGAMIVLRAASMSYAAPLPGSLPN